MGPWARAHGPMISAYFGLFGLISAYLETDSCLFQIIWTLISAYLSLFEFISAYFGSFGSLFRLIWPKKKTKIGSHRWKSKDLMLVDAPEARPHNL